MPKESIASVLGRKIGFLASAIASAGIRPTGDPVSVREECSCLSGPFAERSCS
jgi:hypothetical protein